MRGEHLDRQSQRIYRAQQGWPEDWLPLHPVIALESRRYPSRGLWFPVIWELAGQPLRAKSQSATVSPGDGSRGIPGTPHALRHWFSARNYAAVVWICRTVQELMRHANMATTALWHPS